ncbi:MAG: hypothetical protein CSA62_04585 [Planctomycetota bacterium]|nr:MAG: hypothetical protein CSA62_04585 [Planctomycetota bacterium]
MSNDSHDELDELEPIVEETPSSSDSKAPAEVDVPQAPNAEQLQAHSVGLLQKLVERSFSGMATPLFNPNASKEYYRFFFGGLMIVLGCLMPFDGDWAHRGYGTVAGGFFLLIGLGVCWSMWAAINTGIVRMKWILLTIIPFFYSVFFVISPFPKGEFNGQTEMKIMAPYYEAKDGTFSEDQYKQLLEDCAVLREKDPRCNSWKEFSDDLGKFRQDRSAVGRALQESGPGKWFVFLGSLLVEFTFLMSIFGGFKKIKEQKAARVASSRRR